MVTKENLASGLFAGGWKGRECPGRPFSQKAGHTVVRTSCVAASGLKDVSGGSQTCFGSSITDKLIQWDLEARCRAQSWNQRYNAMYSLSVPSYSMTNSMASTIRSGCMECIIASVNRSLPQDSPRHELGAASCFGEDLIVV